MRRLLRNSVATLAGNAWAVVVTVVTLPLMLHGLGPTLFGLWVLLQTFSAVNGWFSLADVGVGLAATKLVAERAATSGTDGATESVASSLALFLGLAILAAAVLGLLGPVFLPSLFRAPAVATGALRTATLLFAIQVAADLVTGGCQACMEGFQRVDLARGVDAVRRTMVAASTAAAALLSGSLVVVAGASLVTATMATLVALIVLARISRMLGRPSPSVMRGLLFYGSKVGLLNLAGTMHRTMDRIIVGIILGPGSVTVVEVATQVQSGAMAVLSAVSYSVVPAAAWLNSRNDLERGRRLLLQGTKLSLLAALPVAVSAMVLVFPAIPLWVGKSFSGAAPIASIALTYTVFIAPIQVGLNYMQGTGRVNWLIKVQFVAVALNIALSVVLVATIGVAGVFVATTVSTLVLTAAVIRWLGRDIPVPISEFARNVVLPAVLPTIAAGAGALVGVSLPLSAAARLVIGITLSGGAATLLAICFSLSSGERRELAEGVAGRVSPAARSRGRRGLP